MKKLLTVMLAPLMALTSGIAAALEPAPESDDSITIYSRMQPGAVSPEWYRPAGGRNQGGNVPGYGIVRHDRTYPIDKGTSRLRVTDVAALIDPTTVTFRSLDTPATRVLEQSFQFDLVSQQKLLERYLGYRIVIEQFRGNEVDLIEGMLLGIGDGLTLQMDDGTVRAVRDYTNVRFSELPGGLITRPTLEWLLESPKKGPQKTRITYESQGMTWWADYNLILNEAKGCQLDVSAWVSIINQSGASYPDARLKLIAGDVHRAEPKGPERQEMYRVAMAQDEAGFEEKAFFEYHLYTLGRRTDLPDNSTKQIELFAPADDVTCEKELVFAPTLHLPYYGMQQLDRDYGRQNDGKVQVFLQFANEKDNGLGMPLPAGRIRVNQLDTADDTLEFIGEDVIDHTPRNEDVRIRMGNAFDVVGERTQTDFRVDTKTRNVWETFEIRLRNHKDEAVEVAVLENLYRTANWSIEDANTAFTKENAFQVRFEVNIPSEGEAVVRYTAHYTW